MWKKIVNLYQNFRGLEPYHPELRSGEVFLTNAYHGDFDKIGWKTKRAGTFAYENNGKIIIGSLMFPVFIQKKEIIKAGMNPKDFEPKKLFKPTTRRNEK